jgi:hypothetical protein
MNWQDAAYATVHDYPGGCASLAPRIGVSPNVLQNKVNPNQTYHKLTQDESVRIQAFTGDARILHAEAEELGYVCIAAGDFTGVSDCALLDLFNREYAALGKFSEHFGNAFASGGIDPQQRDTLRNDMYSIKRILAEIMARIDALADQSAARARSVIK